MLTAYYLALYFVIKISLSKAQYAFFKEPKTWLQAKDICSSCGGELVKWNENVSEIVSHNDIEKTLVWIGNYTLQYPWLREKGCVSTEDLKFNIIYHNNPEFCSRSCDNSQMFALKGDNCYCVDNGINIHVMCSTGSDNCSSDCGTDKVKVYAFDDVYVCDFEDVSCTNTSYGEEKVGLSWNRTIDNTTDGIGNIGRKKGYFLLLQYPTTTAENEALLSIRLSLPEMYFCLSFKYYMNHGGSLEIVLSSEHKERIIIWKSYGDKGHMWYSSSSDLKGQQTVTIEFLGSLESNTIDGRRSKVAIDDIKLKPGVCNTEKKMDCSFDDDSCEWKIQIPSGLKLQKEDNSDDYFLRNIYEFGTYNLISSDIYPHILNDFCLHFQYYIEDKLGGVSLQAEVNKTKTYRFETSTKASWITATKTFQSKEHTNIILKWRTEKPYVGIDNISVRSGSCEQEIMFSIEDSLQGWVSDRGLEVHLLDLEGKNDHLFIKSKVRNNEEYVIMSPKIPITSTTVLCVQFVYWADSSDISIAIEIKTDDRNTRVLNNIKSDKQTRNSFNFEAFYSYQMILKLTDLTVYKRVWNLAHFMVTAGNCQKDTDEDINDASMGPMCPIINTGDNTRLSLGYCAKLKRQPFICQIEDNDFNSTDTVCQYAVFLNDSDGDPKTTETSLQTTESNIVSNEDHVTSEENDVSTDQHPLNTSVSFLEQEKGKTEMVAITILGILSAILIALLILVLCLLIKLKRTRSSLKEKEKPNNTGPIENRSYEMEAIDASHMPIQTPDDTDYDLASPVNPQPQLNRNINKAHKENAQNNRENDYQNCDKFTPDQKHDSQIYQDMEEGAYDQLGKSADRRKNFNSEADNLYDHGQPVKSQNNGIYDTTESKTGDARFVLEPERGSAIYDHTK